MRRHAFAASVSAPDIVRVVPRRILHASRFLNACHSAFVDHQFAGALAASPPFIQMGAMDRGLNLFQLWERGTAQPNPGYEYKVVDKFAADLRLTGWFRWIDDPGETAPREFEEGSSNPDLLAMKSPATVVYFLEILKRLDRMDAEKIQRVGAEVALTGKDGLDYASPEKNYRCRPSAKKCSPAWKSCVSCSPPFNASRLSRTLRSISTMLTKRRSRYMRGANVKASDEF